MEFKERILPRVALWDLNRIISFCRSISLPPSLIELHCHLLHLNWTVDTLKEIIYGLGNKNNCTNGNWRNMRLCCTLYKNQSSLLQ